MSTFIEIRPTQHATIKTTGVRIDGNFKVTVRTETGGVATDHKVNFSGLLTDQTLQGTDPIGQVRVGKIGTQERVIIEVLAYHAAGEEDKVPAAGQYWYNIKNHYPFGGTPEQGKTVSPNPSFEGTAQTFPIVIFNESTLTAWTANSATSAVPSRLYGQLGTLVNRRQYLKGLILKPIESPFFPILLSGAYLGTLTSINDSDIAIHLHRTQNVPKWLEMLTAAISVDDNLNTERKFNLLQGECLLDVQMVATQAPANLSSLIDRGNSNRSTFRYIKLGDVGSAPTYTYSRTNWQHQDDTEIVLTNSNIGNDWISWLRS